MGPYDNKVPGRRAESFLDADRLFELVRRRRLLICVVALAPALFSMYFWLTAERLYSATGRLTLSPTTRVPTATQYLSDEENYLWKWSRIRWYNGCMAMVFSEAVTKRTEQYLGTRVPLAAIKAGLSVKTPRGDVDEGNDLIEVTYTHRDPQVACDVIGAFCRAYEDVLQEERAKENAEITTRLQTYIRQVSRELEEKETALRLFKEQTGKVDMASQAQTAVSRHADLEMEFYRAVAESAATDARLAYLRGQAGLHRADTVESSTLQYGNHLAELQLQLYSFKAQYGPKHPKIRRIEEELRLLKRDSDNPEGRFVSRETNVNVLPQGATLVELEKTETQSAATRGRRSALKAAVAEKQLELTEYPRQAQRNAELERDVIPLRHLLWGLNAKHQDMTMRWNTQQPIVRVLESAESAKLLAGDSGFGRVLVSLLIGLVLGVGIALLLDALDQKVRQPGLWERTLGVVPLGIIPSTQQVHPIIDEKNKELSGLLESCRVLRANVDRKCSIGGVGSVLVCSAVRGEGRSTVAANLAIAQAMDGKKVVLVDADLRSSGAGELLGVGKEPGMTDFLRDEATLEEIVQPTRYPGLFVVASGSHCEAPPELLGHVRFDTLVLRLRASCDIVIFDSPALLLTSDAQIMMPRLDACLVVGRMRQTPLKAARSMAVYFRRNRVQVLGGVINGVSSRRNYYAYAYSYSSENYRGTPGTRRGMVRRFGLRVEEGLRQLIRRPS